MRRRELQPHVRPARPPVQVQSATLPALQPSHGHLQLCSQSDGGVPTCMHVPCSPPEELVMPKTFPRAPLPVLAALVSPLAWLYGRPDLFDTYSAGVLLLQMSGEERFDGQFLSATASLHLAGHMCASSICVAGPNASRCGQLTPYWAQHTACVTTTCSRQCALGTCCTTDRVFAKGCKRAAPLTCAVQCPSCARWGRRATSTRGWRRATTTWRSGAPPRCLLRHRLLHPP